MKVDRPFYLEGIMGGRGSSSKTNQNWEKDFQTLPEYLQQGGKSPVQYWAFKHEKNNMPEILDKEQFESFVNENGLQDKIIARSVKDSDTMDAKDIMREQFTNKFNYIGGRFGGNTYGDGTYFRDSDGVNRGDFQTRAVLNPRKAKIINIDDIQNTFDRKATTTQKKELANLTAGLDTRKRIGAEKSLKAMMLGYNVIKITKEPYYTVLSREALCIEKNW